MTRGENVVALVRAAGARLSEVVVVRRRADDREDQPWDALPVVAAALVTSESVIMRARTMRTSRGATDPNLEPRR